MFGINRFFAQNICVNISSLDENFTKHHEVSEQAAIHAASKLADMWYHFAPKIPVNANDHVYNDTGFSTGKSAHASAA